MAEEFGRLLKELRLDNKLTQSKLLERLRDQGYEKYGVPDISKWEHGRTKPPVDVVEVLEDILLPARNGLLLKAAGYHEAAESADAPKGEKQRARQRAWVRHFDDLVKVAESLRYNLRVPDPRRAQEEELLISSREYDRLTGFERVEAELHDLRVISAPGPKWYCHSNGSVEIQFLTEEFDLFQSLMDHLKGTGLDAEFWELKRLLTDYIGLCRSSKGKAKGDELPNVPEVANLYRKSKELAGKLSEGLSKFIHRGLFPGRCRFCPE